MIYLLHRKLFWHAINQFFNALKLGHTIHPSQLEFVFY